MIGCGFDPKIEGYSYRKLFDLKDDEIWDKIKEGLANYELDEEQQKVIDLRDKNILVSAAAGSGKTAVLVERIISMISEGDDPIDIDKLLIVTF